MGERRALEKHADSLLTISNHLAVAGALSPFTYLISINTLGQIEQIVLRAAPFVIVIAAYLLHRTALDLFRRIPDPPG